MQKKYAHLSDIIMTYHDTKRDLPVHVILGAGIYTKIKTQERARVGQPGEPIAELTGLGGDFPRSREWSDKYDVF